MDPEMFPLYRIIRACNPWVNRCRLGRIRPALGVSITGRAPCHEERQLQAIVVLALGAGLGYLAAFSDAHHFRQARATSVPQPRNPEVSLEGTVPVTCSDGADKRCHWKLGSTVGFEGVFPPLAGFVGELARAASQPPEYHFQLTPAPSRLSPIVGMLGRVESLGLLSFCEGSRPLLWRLEFTGVRFAE